MGDSFRPLRAKMRQSYPLSGDVSITNWTHRIKETLGIVRTKSIDTCIYEVPKELRKVNEDAYRPRIVSIGPLHEGDHDLQAMDEHKWRYMLHLLQRNPEQEKTLNECGSAIFGLEARARGSYAKTIKFNTYELAEILLVDGCFIIELLLRFSGMRFEDDSGMHFEDEDDSGMHFEDDSDLIFRNAWMIPTLQHDLALLENQIPFFVLEHLLEICVPHNLELPTTQVSIHNITGHALYFFQVKMNGEASRRIQSKYVMHLLDLLHRFYVPTSHGESLKDKRFFLPISHGEIPKGKGTLGFRKCATKLLEAGIEFAKGKDPLLDIRFSNGVIIIPPLFIHETTESLLRNLIAYEQCSLGSSYHITSYAILVKSLIHSSLDVELLQKKGIIINDLGGVEDVWTLFNNISREIVPKGFCFGELCMGVNAHQNSWWNRTRHKAFWRVLWKRQMASLKRNYFPNPWRTISVIAAVLLLLLTGLQTLYTVHSFYANKS